MASIFRRNGVSGRYTVKFRDVQGHWQTIIGYTDVKASEEMGRKLERIAQRRAAGEAPGPELLTWVQGLPDRVRGKLARLGLLDATAVASSRPLTEHLSEYKQALLDGVASAKQKGPATVKHAELSVYRVTTMLDGIGARILADVTVEAVGRYLADRRAKGLSVASSNHYVKSARAFFGWMLRSGRATVNPVAGVGKIQLTAKARKLIRRPLEIEEAKSLLDATRSGPVRYGMGAEERYWLYRVALETALRSSELRALTRANFRLDDKEPMVWLPGDATKNRQPAELPLRAETIAELRTYLSGKHPGAVVFPTMPIVTDVAYMLRMDLSPAGIESETDAGRVDFHALRTSCLSWLADAGTPLRTLQEFARHSTPTLTMNSYARTLRDSMPDAIARLPDLAAVSSEAAKAVGTYAPGPFRKSAPKSAPNGVPFDSRRFAAVQRSGEGGQREPDTISGCKNRDKRAPGGASKRTGVDGNRTHQGSRLRPFNGFEGRGTHQASGHPRKPASRMYLFAGSFPTQPCGRRTRGGPPAI